FSECDPGTWSSTVSNPTVILRCALGPRASRADGDALHREHLDDIADLDVVELLEADAALEPGLHLADIVLEPAQRPDLPLVDDDVVADQARLRVAGADDAALGDHAAGNRAVLRDLEGVPHLGDPDADLLERRLEEAGHRLLHLVGDVVDDRVRADLDALA